MSLIFKKKICNLSIVHGFDIRLVGRTVGGGVTNQNILGTIFCEIFLQEIFSRAIKAQ